MKDNIQIEILDNPDFLYIRLLGTWSEDTAEVFISRIRQALDALDKYLVLIDTRDQKYETSVFSDYFTAENLKITGVIRNRKVAFITDPIYEDRIMPFILRIKGEGINCSLFNDKDKAVEWLTAGIIEKLSEEQYLDIIDSTKK